MGGLRLQLLLLLPAQCFLILLAAELLVHLPQRGKQGVRVLADPRRFLQDSGSFFNQTFGGVFQVHLCHSQFFPLPFPASICLFVCRPVTGS